MNTDELRHLLEMAAKACGAQIEPCVCSSQPFRFKSTGGHWSPHVDDGTSANWTKRRRLHRDIAMLLRSALQQAGRRGLITRCRISITRYASREPDPDGMSATGKLILDALQPQSARHPCGQGVIAEDTSECVTELSVVHARGSNLTEIEIEVLR